MTIALTGHRPNKLGNEYNLKGPYSSALYTKIKQILLQEKATTIITGMALGADQLFCKIGIETPEITKIIAAIPFLGQETAWPAISVDLYNSLLTEPKIERYYVCEPGYHPQKMQIRNEWMVDNCDKLIAIWDGSKGGTGNCVRYAKKAGREIIRINPLELFD